MRKCDKIIVQRGRPHVNMAHAHCMMDTEGYKHTPHSDCLILVVFPLQQRLHEHTPVWRHTYCARTVLFFSCWDEGEQTEDGAVCVLS
jgi:hypothetical protein